MFEKLMLHGAALAEKAARRRRSELAAELGEDAPAGIEVSEEEAGVVLSGRGLERRAALDPGLRWLPGGRRR